ncbi:hypothetical protein Q5P01_014210 [Channa striata]|uniref:Immunoglobulin I-set domain-containing protein n=1 Tax=Channa striata TaxID=64152 RepID=A0AA88MPE4_CHASR|nr:hypothetical protein Q5P01_014210 [Channa striata]
MTTAVTDKTVECGRQEVGGIIFRDGGEKEGNRKLSSTTLSTIAIQAGRSQIVISVLKSGALVHLQLVQVHPGLCEIGLSKAENQTLIQEQQQLIEKLKKHEREVLAVVEKSQQKELKKRDQNREKQDVYKAMAASLTEGWSLLLHLLKRRQEVLTLASDFYNKTHEFNISIDRVGDLQIKPGDKRLGEIQLMYNSMRRELLEKSLQVLSSSSVLLHKLRQLQRTETLQIRGAVLQEDEEQQEDEGPHCSRGVVLKLEELVETLQDRRRKLDQAVRLKFQQVESSTVDSDAKGSLRQTSSVNWSPDNFLHPFLLSGSPSAEIKDLVSYSRIKETKNPDRGFRSGESAAPDSELQHECALKTQSDSTLKQATAQQPESDVNQELQCKSTSVESTNLLPGYKLQLQSVPRCEETRSFLKPGSREDVQSACRSNLSPGSSSQDGKLQAADELSRTQDETKNPRDFGSRQAAGQKNVMGKESQSEEGHTHQSFLTSQRHQLLLSCQQLVEKVWSWVQQASSVLSNSSKGGRQLPEAEDCLNTHLQLQTQAQSAGHDAEKLRKMLDEIRALHTDPTSRTSHHFLSEASRQLSPLKALTVQLKSGRTDKHIRSKTAWSGPEVVDAPCTLSIELAAQVHLILKELQGVNRKINANLQLLQPYVSFLRTAQQVEEELEELREIYRRRLVVEEQEGSVASYSDTRPPQKKRQEMLQRFLTAQYLGNNYIHTVTTVSGSGLNPQSLVPVVQQTVERLRRTQQEVNELESQQQIQIRSNQQEDMKYCKNYQERLFKTQQDLNCVSEVLDSCTLMDLGSDLQTSRLLECFGRARPHLNQLDAEVEYLEKSWERVRGIPDRLKGLIGATFGDIDLSELLTLHERVKDKIQQSELILDLCSSFHLAAKQLEALIQSDPARHSTGSRDFCGSSEAELRQHREKEQQIQSLFQKTSALKTEISAAVNRSGWTCFSVEQLEARLLSLDSLWSSWLSEAARCEEKLLSDYIHQLRDSFKDLKKRFSNTKFKYLKGNDRTRNMKTVRNQLQQMGVCEEKLQALRKRLQGLMSLLGSEVKDGGVAREVDAVNELQRQMCEFEQSVSEHQKSLDMTCRLQQAMEEYQFWCEEAIATIARVGKFSLECRSTKAVSVLHQQFEKFVWPTVPQQEERVRQISELAVRLHGVEEGQRYIEKTVSKHSEMVKSIRELSDALMELKLKLESLKERHNDGEKELKGEEKVKLRTEEETGGGAEEREKKQKDQTDNHSTQEAAEPLQMYELKETGHTPELTTHSDGKEVPVKRQTAANGRPQIQKSHSEETDRLTNASTSSHRQSLYNKRMSSNHTFSPTCSPAETNQCVHAVPTPILSSLIGLSFSDIQFQGKDMQEESAAEQTEMELHQQEQTTEDSLSNDEYECASPDDISLPPLAETPESNMVQSDPEESICFSSHSIHISQYHAQVEHSGTDSATSAVQQQTTQTEHGPTPPTNLHSRFSSESSPFVQSQSTFPAPSTFTNSLHSILKTAESTTAYFPQGFNSGSHPVHKSNTPDSCHKVPEKRSCSQTGCLLLENNSQCNSVKGTTNFDPKLGRELDFEQGKSLSHNTGFLKGISSFPQIQTAICPDVSFTDSLSNSESSSVSKSHMDPPTNTVTQQRIYFESNPSHNPCTWAQANSSSPQSIPEFTLSLFQDKTVPQICMLADSAPHEVRAYAAFPQTSTAMSKARDFPQIYTDSSYGHDQGGPSISVPSTHTPSSIVTHQTVCQSFPAERNFTCPQASSTLRKECPSSSCSGDLADGPTLPEPNNISSVTSSNRLNRMQSKQTVCSLHESLTSMCTQQCVHGLGINPSSPPRPAPSPQLKTANHAFVQDANLHVSPHQHPPSPLHPLIPEPNPDICQPMAILEEIKLTPQIQGPPVAAPPSQTECLPNKPGPPCFTRPLSRATVIEGSPVMLEVEVMGQPEPTLTWCKGGQLLATGPGQALDCGDRKEASHGLFETWTTNDQDSHWTAANSSSDEVLDIISVDWQTWFGTMCFLLFLIYLIVL